MSDTTRPRPAAVAVASRIVVTAAAVLVVVSAVQARQWLGWRALMIVALGAAALIVLWRPAERSTRGWAAALATGGGLVAATGLGRVARGDPLPPPAWWHGGDDGYVAQMGDRILGRDLPPVGVYAIVVAAAVLVVGCPVLALLPRAGPVGRRALVLGVLAGVVVGALAVAATVTVTRHARTAADRRAEGAVVTAPVRRSGPPPSRGTPPVTG